MTQTINNITFNSKKKLEEYIRNIIIPCGQNEYINATTNTNHFLFLKELLIQHESYERKKKEGTIGVPKYITFDSTNKMIITWDNDKTTAVSWKKCLGRKKGSINNKFNSAMRMSINDQTFLFKQKMWENKNYLICNLCNIKTLNESEAFSEKWHVDHEPSFSKIKNQFLNKTSQKKPTEFKDVGGFGWKSCKKTFKNEQDSFVKEWINFHKKFAKYQILCRSCNCSKGNN